MNTNRIVPSALTRTCSTVPYEQFSLAHPDDYAGRSLSVSDVVALKQDGQVSCHYIDSWRFVELPAFLQPENSLKNTEMAMEDDYGSLSQLHLRHVQLLTRAGHLQEVLPDVMKELSPKQVAFALAATLQIKEYDGRFSRDNKAWAATIDTSFSASPAYDHRPSFCVESHPAVLDGFVSMFRKEMCRERKPSVIEKLHTKSTQTPQINPSMSVKQHTGMER